MASSRSSLIRVGVTYSCLAECTAKEISSDPASLAGGFVLEGICLHLSWARFFFMLGFERS